MESETPLTYSLGLRTDTGQQRSHNEDAGAIFDLPGARAAFVVCDGMGGLRSGDIASNEAVRVVQESMKNAFAAGVPDPIKALGEAFRHANDAVNTLNRAEQTAAAPGSGAGNPPGRATEGPQALMGTTCVAGVVLGNTLYLAHAGDSRAYRWRRGNLSRLTHDHSFVAEQVKAGNITEAQARTSRYRNMITRAIGIDDTVEPDFRQEPIEPGDVLLVCSDGLTTMIDDPEIAGLMNAPTFRRNPTEKAAATLVDAANKKGGEDNITVLLMRASGETESAMPTELDADAPRPPKGASPWVWIIVGIVLTLLVVAGLMLFSHPARQAASSFLDHRAQTSTVGGKGRPDYKRLVYDAPVSFAPDFFARGDLLTYAPGIGLYFVAGQSGKVALLSAEGKAVRSVETLEIMESRQQNPASTRVFVASDPQGNVYLSYTKRGVVIKKGADGKFLTKITGFQMPEAIAVDEAGNVYVVDFNQIKVSRARLPRPGEEDPSAPAASPTPKSSTT